MSAPITLHPALPTQPLQWAPTPSLPALEFNCSTDPGTPRFVRWNDSIEYPYVVCTAANRSLVYPCCESLGGEARTLCNRTMCLTNHSSSNWFTCQKTLSGMVGGGTDGVGCGGKEPKPGTTPSGVIVLPGAAAPTAKIQVLGAALIVLLAAVHTLY